MSRRIDVSPATLSAIETGKTGVSVPRLRLLAAELGTTTQWLIGDLPSPRPTGAASASLRSAGRLVRGASSRGWILIHCWPPRSNPS
nr:helix-turn-helix transcriptional regulator [Nocardia mangyaensis]